ncbi:MAG: hypothetical protein J7578_08420 [Chitinophagaceae bacterium]|nr:hypothetical protein [Chitinophagaceae bacterium]
MKSLILSLLTGLFLVSCYTNGTRFPYHSRLPDGYYESRDHYEVLYLKISKDSAFADFMYLEKFPRYLRSDTLLYDPAAKKWVNEKFSLYQPGEYYELSNYRKRDTQHRVHPVIYHIRANKKLNKRLVDTDKNYAYVHAEQSKYQFSGRDPNRYQLLRQKYGLFDSLSILSHEELLAAFKKFKEELYKE